MKSRHESWFSPSLQRSMEFLHFGDRGFPIVLFPTSKGSFHQYRDMKTVEGLADKIDAGCIQLFCVDSIDAESWYNREADPAERALRHVDYDRYLREEMVPHMQREAQSHHIGVFGCSFGAYHAANFAARYPDIVAKVVCLSGIFNVYQFLDDHWDETCFQNCPTAYIPKLSDEWVGRLRGIHWVVASGELDVLAPDNRDFSHLLWTRGIANHAEIWPGVSGHDWPWWNEHAARFY